MNFLMLLAVAILQARPGQPGFPGSNPPDTNAGWGIVNCLFCCCFPFVFVGLIPIVGMCKTFAKAGQPAWAALVPIYNTYVMCEIAGTPDLFIWTFIPFANI